MSVSDTAAEGRKPDLLRVFHRRVIGHRPATQEHSDRKLRVQPFQPAEQYFVHDDLAAVVGDIGERPGRRCLLPQVFKALLIHRDLRRPVEELHEPLLLHIFERGKVDEVPHHRILHSAPQRIVGLADAPFQLVLHAQHQVIEVPLDLRVIHLAFPEQFLPQLPHTAKDLRPRRHCPALPSQADHGVLVALHDLFGRPFRVLIQEFSLHAVSAIAVHFASLRS